MAVFVTFFTKAGGAGFGLWISWPAPVLDSGM